MNTKPLFTERDQQSEPLLKQLKSVTVIPIYKLCFFDFGMKNLLEYPSIIAVAKELPSSETIQALNSFWRQFYCEFSQPAFRFFSLTLCVCALLASEKGYAEVVSYRAEGTVTSISGDTSLLPLSSNVGDPITLDFSYDLNETDTNTTVSYSGSYPATSMTVTLGSNPSTAVSMPTVRTQSAPFTDLWGIRGELGGSTVRLNFFLPTGSVSSDALTVPPSPVPPGTTVQFGFWANDPVGDNDAFVVAQLDQIDISVPTITCSMVEPPLNVDDPNTQDLELLSITNKDKRVIPVKVQLVDKDGLPVVETDIPISNDNTLNLPVISVLFTSSNSSSTTIESELSNGKEDEGNIFRFTEGEDQVIGTDDDVLQFNLSTKSLKSSGYYTPIIKSGDDQAYKIECNLPSFVRK